MSDISKTMKLIRSAAPMQADQLMWHIKHMREDANNQLIMAIPTEALRQSQGKVQVLTALLEALEPGEHS